MGLLTKILPKKNGLPVKRFGVYTERPPEVYLMVDNGRRTSDDSRLETKLH